VRRAQRRRQEVDDELADEVLVRQVQQRPAGQRGQRATPDQPVEAGHPVTVTLAGRQPGQQGGRERVGEGVALLGQHEDPAATAGVRLRRGPEGAGVTSSTRPYRPLVRWAPRAAAKPVGQHLVVGADRSASRRLGAGSTVISARSRARSSRRRAAPRSTGASTARRQPDPSRQGRPLTAARQDLPGCRVMSSPRSSRRGHRIVRRWHDVDARARTTAPAVPRVSRPARSTIAYGPVVRRIVDEHPRAGGPCRTARWPPTARR
jgi:hypothetical protein